MTMCEHCGGEIPAARLAALPHTTECLACSTEKKVHGHTYWDGKHTPVLEVQKEKKFEDRRGFHASLPMGSKNNPRVVASVANFNLSEQIKLKPPVEYDVARVIPARCHPDRPKAVPNGMCLECALKTSKHRRA